MDSNTPETILMGLEEDEDIENVEILPVMNVKCTPVLFKMAPPAFRRPAETMMLNILVSWEEYEQFLVADANLWTSQPEIKNNLSAFIS